MRSEGGSEGGELKGREREKRTKRGRELRRGRRKRTADKTEEY